MAETSIEWTDHSINPIRFGKGHYCQKLSPGCAHCYASGTQPRFGNAEFGGTGSKLPMVAFEQSTERLWLDESKLQEVLRRKKPTKYFWCDMTDLFGSWVPDEWIDRCFAVMAMTPQHTHQVLTKRSERMRDYILGADGREIKFDVPGLVLDRQPFDWPLPSVWLGVSAEDQQRADERIPHLLATPATVRFLSGEPLLGPLRISKYFWPVHQHWPARFDTPAQAAMAGEKVLWKRQALVHADARFIDWVIVGGESGRGEPRPMHQDWARSIRDQCHTAGVPFFFKQWGAWYPFEQHGLTPGKFNPPNANKATEWRYGDGKPAFMRVGKKAAGDVLDGVQWHQFPEVPHA